MSRMEIRPTTTEDLNALADVLVEVHAKDGYPVEGIDDPRAWVDLPGALGQWTALLENRPVGHLALLRPEPGDGAPGLLAEREGVPIKQIAVVARLFIAPRARGRALAAGLVARAESTARECGCWTVLDVMTKDSAAISLYRSLGWREIGRHDHVYAGGKQPALAMVRPPLAGHS